MVAHGLAQLGAVRAVPLEQLGLTVDGHGKLLAGQVHGADRGEQERMVPSAHSRWLAAHCRGAELWLRPDDGHVSVLGSSARAALDWLVALT